MDRMTLETLLFVSYLLCFLSILCCFYFHLFKSTKQGLFVLLSYFFDVKSTKQGLFVLLAPFSSLKSTKQGVFVLLTTAASQLECGRLQPGSCLPGRSGGCRSRLHGQAATGALPRARGGAICRPARSCCGPDCPTT